MDVRVMNKHVDERDPELKMRKKNGKFDVTFSYHNKNVYK